MTQLFLGRLVLFCFFSFIIMMFRSSKSYFSLIWKTCWKKLGKYLSLVVNSSHQWLDTWWASGPLRPGAGSLTPQAPPGWGQELHSWVLSWGHSYFASPAGNLRVSPQCFLFLSLSQSAARAYDSSSGKPLPSILPTLPPLLPLSITTWNNSGLPWWFSG